MKHLGPNFFWIHALALQELGLKITTHLLSEQWVEFFKLFSLPYWLANDAKRIVLSL